MRAAGSRAPAPAGYRGRVASEQRYTVTERRIVYDGALSRVRIDRVRMPDGQEVDREVVEHPDAVAIVPVHDDGTVTLLRQYRHPVGESLLELPAGKLDVDGERPEQTARRELAEEVGLAAGRLTPLLTFHNSSGWTDEATTLYLAEELQAAPAPDGFEAAHEEADIVVERHALTEAVARAGRGELNDAKTALGLLLVGAQRGLLAAHEA